MRDNDMHTSAPVTAAVVFENYLGVWGLEDLTLESSSLGVLNQVESGYPKLEKPCFSKFIHVCEVVF